MFYTRNVGYQKKGIDPLNSKKVIPIVSDVLYGRKRQKKPAKSGEKCKDVASLHSLHDPQVKIHDCETWNFLNEENFGCWTSDLLIVCLGGDHAIEQGIRGVKSTGGPSHITSNHDAMNVYFKSALAMARTVADFKQSYNIKKESENDAHYELTGSSNKLLTSYN